MSRRDRPLEGLPKEDLEKLAKGSKQDTPRQQHHADTTQAEAAAELKAQREEGK